MDTDVIGRIQEDATYVLVILVLRITEGNIILR